jgi:hypothetical protein
MSKERELLKECVLILDNPFNGTRAIKVAHRIKELLAQPEQKVMTNRAIIQACPDHYCDTEKEAFKVGIKWYEKYVARVGVYNQDSPDYEDGLEFEGWGKRSGVQEPMTGKEISHGFRADKDANNAESYWAGVALAEKHYGVKINED